MTQQQPLLAGVVGRLPVRRQPDEEPLQRRTPAAVGQTPEGRPVSRLGQGRELLVDHRVHPKMVRHPPHFIRLRRPQGAACSPVGNGSAIPDGATLAAMPRRDPDRVASLALDPGVLAPGPVLELFGWRAAAAHGGTAVAPWRADARAAAAAGVAVVATVDDLADDRVRQAVVHLQKGRDGSWAGLAAAWERLGEGGRLVLVGSNDLGVKSAADRLERELGQPGEVRANRARGRAVSFVRTRGDGPPRPAESPITVVAGADRFAVVSEPGVFSADDLDPGSRLLLDNLDRIGNAGRVLDAGCGLGVLGLAALRRYPTARAVLADADARAVAAARRSAAALGVERRCEILWWDATVDPPPAAGCDLVVCNPPFHRGVRIDLGTARAVLDAAARSLAPGGLALVVALRTLPFERDLAAHGGIEQIAERDGYKLLRLRRPANRGSPAHAE